MTHKAADHTTTQSSSGKNPEILGAIGMDVLNTAWRMALPILFFAVIGLFVDRHFESGPWVTLAATVIGLGVAALLVKRQLAALEAKER